MPREYKVKVKKDGVKVCSRCKGTGHVKVSTQHRHKWKFMPRKSKKSWLTWFKCETCPKIKGIR